MIFVSIAAYRDNELPDTLDSVVDNSTHDLHISIVEQCTSRERIDISKWESDRVKISLQWMHPLQARGAGYARHLAMQKYAGEDHYLQIDSHTDLIQNWDEKMITALNLAYETEQSSKVILSHYPAGYEPHNHTRYRMNSHKRYKSKAMGTRAKVGRTGQLAAARVDIEGDRPALSTMVLAGYIFGPGNFTELGYPHNIAFWGEEFYVSINAWMNGWRIYSPHEMYVWHHYVRRGGNKVWDDLSEWKDIDESSQLYLEEYFQNLMGSDKWILLHDNHRETIHKWLAHRRGVRGEEHTEQDIDIEYIMNIGIHKH